MLQSQLFTKTAKTFPKDEESVNAKYLIRAGYINKSSAGVYTYLPLGWRALNKVTQIVREEMDAIGGQELLMPSLIAKKYWQKSGRWDIDVVYKVKAGREEFGLGWTHEEVIAAIAEHHILSEKDLPKYLYQIQTKFRMEPRARSGLVRCREFLMKDLYSFHKTKDDLEKYYQKVTGAYKKIFKRISLPYKIAEASGGAFTKEYTHEFQTLVDSGEDTVLYCDKCDFAQNKEIAKIKEGGKCPKCSGKIVSSRAIEVANIFRLGQRFSPPLGGWMGSYGFGPSRALGALVEVSHDDKGLVWPEPVAPFKVHLLQLGKTSAVKLYRDLVKRGVEVLHDDRSVSAGEKLVDADLLGMPWRLVVSEKTGKKIELKARKSKKIQWLDSSTILRKMSAST